MKSSWTMPLCVFRNVTGQQTTTSARRFVLLLLLGLASLMFLQHRASAADTPQKRPNIILIMADDLGFSDLGCYGSEIKTPNIDSLAASGLRFTQFYNTARCCPTRAALLTGLYSHQAGVGHMVEDTGYPAYQGYLNDRCVTIAEAIRPAGYHPLMVGKWHVGEDRPHWPVDRGFEHYFGLISGASNYFFLEEGRKMARDNEPFVPSGDDFYMTDAFSDQAVKYVDEYGRRPEPFFLYVAYTAPHFPLHAHPEDIAKYQGKYRQGWDALREARYKRQVEMGLIDSRWALTPRDADAPAWSDVPEKDKERWDLNMAVFAAQVDRMDQGVGKILAKLREVGAEENTLVMFLADNGGTAERIQRGDPALLPGSKESYLSYGMPWANLSNTPFRLYKHWEHEGGISSPLIVRWPAVIRTSGITREVGHLIDVMATCVDVSGSEYPKTHRGREVRPLEGKTLRPIFTEGKRAGHEYLFWEHEGNRAVRAGRWKLVAEHKGPWELYDMESDRTELHNVASANTEIVSRLSAEHDKWAARNEVVPWDEVQPKVKARAKRPIVPPK
jgi:arylsulfatase A-like enzyme